MRSDSTENTVSTDPALSWLPRRLEDRLARCPTEPSTDADRDVEIEVLPAAAAGVRTFEDFEPISSKSFKEDDFSLVHAADSLQLHAT
jgi:hypothetical protein